MVLPGGCARTPATARTLVRTWLLAWGIPDAQTDDPALIVTELTTNAVVHTESAGIVVEVQITGRGQLRRLRIRVSDQGPHSGPIRIPPAVDPDGPGLGDVDESGRGLAMVDTLAHRWGAVRMHPGTRVWAVLLLPAESSSAPAPPVATSGGGR
ncbi:ATP-binding protein [Streptomyces synnematoformans]|uniref:ATP-binding protein n=1 Tax=Streptomyces synnematoformans TaxID=415721 RepID=UPI0031DCE152